MNPQAKQLWKDIRNPNCTECPLHEEAQTVCLVGDGPVPAKVMIIGEAPGFREDDVRRPFSGKSGKFLDQALEAAGLSREQAFLTNVAKCRPPDNRTPTRGEIKACRHYLDAEIEAVKPEYILTVGNAALSLVKKSGIMKHRGEIIDYNGSKVLPTVHPAAVLRNPNYDSVFRTDLATFSRLVRDEPGATPPRTFMVRDKRSLSALCRAIMASPAIAYDLETTGTEEYVDGAKIVTVGVSPKPGLAFVVPIEHPDTPFKDPSRVLSIIGNALMFTPGKIIAHNAKFDDRWMTQFGLPLHADFCTMIAAHVLDENRFKSLKFLAQLILGVDPWADVDLGGGGAMTTPLPKLARYNAKDADYTLRLYYHFREELTASGNERTLRLFTKLLMPASKALTTIERTGMWVDQERLLNRRLELKARMERVHRRLVKLIGHDANWNSPQQVAQILFGELKLPMFDLTRTGKPSTKESVMLRLKHKHKVPALILKWRELSKQEGTYLGPWSELLDRGGRIHTHYKITGTVTGRLSSGKEHAKAPGINVQQIPRDTFIRSIIGAPPGWKFVEADFSQIELRIAAHYAQDPTMMRLFQLGEDIHLATAVKMMGKHPDQITPEERKKAKSVNFGFLFGMGWEHFIEYAFENYDIIVTEHEAKAFRDDFFIAFSRIRAWHERQRRLVRNYGKVQSLIGRVRHLPDIESQDQEVRKEAERQAINSPVQGLASDFMLLALGILHEQMPPDEAKIVGTIHDSGLFEIRDDVVDKWCGTIKYTMEHLPIKRLFGAELSVPVTVDVKVGQHWGEGEIWSPPTTTTNGSKSGRSHRISSKVTLLATR
jgi:DNA polymerase-1